MPFIIIGTILGVVIIAALTVSYVCYRLAFKRKGRSPDPHARIKCPEGVSEEEVHGLIDGLLAERCERVEITSLDGKRLTGALYLRKEGAPFRLMCHGYGSSPFRDMSGGALAALGFGYNLLLINHRAHADSEGRCLTFGAKEKQDVLLWAKYLVELTGGRSEIVLTGLSMGAATVLLASELEFPPEVKCIVADCPYSSAEEMLKLEIKRRRLPTFLFYPLMRLGAKLYGGFSLSECDVKEAVKRARVPAIILHGEADDFVPADMSREIYKNYKGEKDMFTVEGATHGMCFMVDTKTYHERVEGFIRRYLTPWQIGEKND